MKDRKEKLPKLIWFLWLQGNEKMPWIVRECFMSWERNNPGWEFIFLEEKNIAEFIEIEKILTPRNHSITSQALSDIIRINLLHKYGGVWVDATCFCCKPLDQWLYPYLQTGFFAFDRPGNDRMLSSWFLAACKGNYIIEKYCSSTNLYWQQNRGLSLSSQSVLSMLYNKLTGTNSLSWFSPLFTKIFKVYPYFWFHYLFEKNYREDILFKKAWDDTPKYSAAIPLKLYYSGILETPSDTMRAIENKKDPLYKLSLETDTSAPASCLEYLLSRKANPL